MASSTLGRSGSSAASASPLDWVWLAGAKAFSRNKNSKSPAAGVMDVVRKVGMSAFLDSLKERGVIKWGKSAQPFAHFLFRKNAFHFCFCYPSP
jgi:hypothetical protein